MRAPAHSRGMNISACCRSTSRCVLVVVEWAWPVLAGSLVAVGGMGLVRAWGVPGVLVISLGTWAFAAVMIFGLMSDYAITFRRTVRVALVVTVAVLDVVGLLMLMPVAGAAAAALAALTSPLVTDRGTAILHPPASRASQKAVDRRFAQIVADLDDPSWRTGA